MDNNEDIFSIKRLIINYIDNNHVITESSLWNLINANINLPYNKYLQIISILISENALMYVKYTLNEKYSYYVFLSKKIKLIPNIPTTHTS